MIWENRLNIELPYGQSCKYQANHFFWQYYGSKNFDDEVETQLCVRWTGHIIREL